MRLLAEVFRSASVPVLVIAAGVLGINYVPASDPIMDALAQIIDGLSTVPQILGLVAIELLGRGKQRADGERMAYAKLFEGMTRDQLLAACFMSSGKFAPSIILALSIFWVRF